MVRPALREHAGLCYLLAQLTVRRRNALAMTLTDDSAMAAAAMIGDSRMPNAGYRTRPRSARPRRCK